MRSLVLAAVVSSLTVLSSCHPVFRTRVSVTDPTGQPISQATIAVSCPVGSQDEDRGVSGHTGEDGQGEATSGGDRFPKGCDVVVFKPGYKLHRTPYQSLCPKDSKDCDRVFDLKINLIPLVGKPIQ